MSDYTRLKRRMGNCNLEKKGRQMKPSWKDAPEWAQWLARDASGLWCFFETEPKPDNANEMFQTNNQYKEMDYEKEIAWQETLEKRPEQ